jgi:hypothetical protein
VAAALRHAYICLVSRICLRSGLLLLAVSEQAQTCLLSAVDCSSEAKLRPTPLPPLSPLLLSDPRQVTPLAHHIQVLPYPIPPAGADASWQPDEAPPPFVVTCQV